MVSTFIFDHIGCCSFLTFLYILFFFSYFFFFFFKQKTAYEMRISDWSSDVCSSDLLTYVELVEGTAVAGVTTQSKCPSPEVEWCRDAIPLGSARALVVNAGNANAFTGHRGRELGRASWRERAWPDV